MPPGKINLSTLILLFVMLFNSAPVEAQDTHKLCVEAKEYQDSGDHRRALSIYNEVLRLQPSNSGAYALRARSRAELGDRSGALSDFDMAIQLGSKSKHLQFYYFYRANCRVRWHDFDGAIRDFNLILAREPKNLQAIYRRDYVRHKAGRNPEFVDYKNMDEEFFDPARMENVAGEYSFNQENYQDALRHFNRALDLNPKSAWAFCDRGSTYVELQDYQSAIRDYTQAIKLKPSYAKAYQGRGNTYRIIGNPQKALSDLNLSVKLNPSFERAFFTRGVLKAETKDFRGAIADYSTALTLEPNYTDACYMRAEAKLCANDPNGAKRDLMMTLKIDPDYCNASRLLARLDQPVSERDNSWDTVRTMELLDARDAYNRGDFGPMSAYRRKYGTSF